MLPRYSIRTLLGIFAGAAVAALTFGSALHGTGIAVAVAVMITAVATALICQAVLFAFFTLVSQPTPYENNTSARRPRDPNAPPNPNVAVEIQPRGTLDLGE